MGDWVGASGAVMTTKKGELSVRVTDFELLQKSLRPLPDKWHGLQDVELRSRRRYIDLMVNEDARRVALVRAGVVSELRRQFEQRGYVEVETPVLLSQATGALARPFQTEHNALGMDMYLRIATELFLKRLVVGGLERVFEIGRIFRNEGVDSTHNPEFTMLESYEAFADYGDIATMVEEMLVAGGAPSDRIDGDHLPGTTGRPDAAVPPRPDGRSGCGGGGRVGRLRSPPERDAGNGPPLRGRAGGDVGPRQDHRGAVRRAGRGRDLGTDLS